MADDIPSGGVLTPSANSWTRQTTRTLSRSSRTRSASCSTFCSGKWAIPRARANGYRIFFWEREGLFYNSPTRKLSSQEFVRGGGCMNLLGSFAAEFFKCILHANLPLESCDDYFFDAHFKASPPISPFPPGFSLFLQFFFALFLIQIFVLGFAAKNTYFHLTLVKYPSLQATKICLSAFVCWKNSSFSKLGD